MKPAPFAYHAPISVEETLQLLTAHGDDAKVLAGGQSLIPTMNFRLAQPAILIDLNGVDGLDHIDIADGEVTIGAMCRQRTVERHAGIAKHAPLVHEAVRYVAHPQIRNRGTFGGSIAHADPAAELPAVLLARQAHVRIRGTGGSRSLRAEEFFTGLFATALADDEILTEIVIPPLPPRAGWAFEEVARRHGDFALVGVAACVEIDTSGACTLARIALVSVGDGPVLAPVACSELEGRAPTPSTLRAASRAAGQRDIDPPGDIHASAAFRRQLATVLTERALVRAFQRAGTAR